jgi:hypothetical protein
MLPRLLALALPLAFAVSAAPAADDRPKPREPFTAFPEIDPPVWTKDGPDLDKAYPLMIGASPRAIPPDAPAWRKLRIARLNELARFIALADPNSRRPERWHGGHHPGYQAAYRAAWLAAGRLGAELEETDPARVPWFEERVRALKDYERSAVRRRETGIDLPYSPHAARADRYAAELDLLRANALAATVKGPPARPKPPAPAKLDPKAEPFTAFPDLKPPDPKEDRRDALADRWKEQYPKLVGGKPLVLGPGDTTRLKLLKARLNAGRAFTQRIAVVFAVGRPDDTDRFNLADLLPRLVAAGAELEETGAGRVAWYEEHVRLLWELERLTTARVEATTDPPEMIHLARARRLAAEADLLDVKEPGPVLRRPPEFTAFPHLRPQPPRHVHPAEPPPAAADPGAERPPDDPLIPLEATVLRIARSNEAWRYVIGEQPVPRPNRWTPIDMPSFFNTLAVAARTRAELERNPEERERWYGTRVVKAKEMEAFVKGRVFTGIDPPQLLDFAVFHRLTAELELLDLIERNRAVK